MTNSTRRDLLKAVTSTAALAALPAVAATLLQAEPALARPRSGAGCRHFARRIRRQPDRSAARPDQPDRDRDAGVQGTGAGRVQLHRRRRGRRMDAA